MAPVYETVFCGSFVLSLSRVVTDYLNVSSWLRNELWEKTDLIKDLTWDTVMWYKYGAIDKTKLRQMCHTLVKDVLIIKLIHAWITPDVSGSLFCVVIYPQAMCWLKWQAYYREEFPESASCIMNNTQFLSSQSQRPDTD